MDITTLNGLKYSTACYYNMPLIRDSKSLLNTKFNVLPSASIPNTTLPNQFAIAIGNGGRSQISASANGVIAVQPLPYVRTWAALYNHIPFIIRPATNDLTPAQRAGYAMRVPFTIGSTAYVAYYLKRISFTGATMAASQVNITNGVIGSPTTYVSQDSDLNPSAPTLNADGTSTQSNTYVEVTAVLDISLSQSDCQEIYNACNTMFGVGYSTISELGIVAGVNQSIIIPSDSSTFNEMAAAQLMSIHTTNSPIDSNTTSMPRTINVGVPLPIVMTVNTTSSET